jgi:glycosyltransferase involved in cell wall biosynthesis
MAMQAYERVHREVPNSRMLVIGGGFQWQRLIEFAKANYNHVPIIFHGWFPPSAMPCILREADIGILPFAIDNEWIRSKSPTKLYEYMASGLAVVATNLGEVSYIIQHGINGMLVNHVDEMVAAMRKLALDSNFRKTISRNARQTMECHYSMEVLGDRLAGFLREVMPGKR